MSTGPTIGSSSLRRSRPDRQLSVVSHRLPVTYQADVGWTRSPGGLVSALGPALAGRAAVWFGHGAHGDPDLPTDGVARFRALHLGRTEREAAIDGMCNRTLWPALHGQADVVEERPEWTSAYFALARKSASTIAREAQAGSLLWVHDYHHLGLARELQRMRPDLRVGIFLHTPVDGDVVGALAAAREIVESLADFDVIGTQTDRDADQVGSLIERFGLRAPRVVRSMPVGFDVAQWQAFAADGVVLSLAERLRRPTGVLAVGVDRADYTKGLLEKVDAIGSLLDRSDLTPDEFRLVQVATRSRPGIESFDRVARDLARRVGEITAAHPRSDGLPVIDLVTDPMSPREVAGLMRASDLALVTPLRDGMNLVALEHAVLNADRGVAMVLSDGAGASTYVGSSCITVDATDPRPLREAILLAARAAGDPQPLLARSHARGTAAAQLTAERWVADFLTDLDDYLAPRIIAALPDRLPD